MASVYYFFTVEIVARARGACPNNLACSIRTCSRLYTFVRLLISDRDAGNDRLLLHETNDTCRSSGPSKQYNVLRIAEYTRRDYYAHTSYTDRKSLRAVTVLKKTPPDGRNKNTTRLYRRV